MKRYKVQTLLWFFSLLSASLSCQRKADEVIGSGSFEAEEVLVSAQSSGIVQRWDIREGMSLQESVIVGLIDTTQLELQKKSLMESVESVKQQAPNVSRQTAALKKQLQHLEVQRARTQRLLEAEVASQVQLDNISNQISLLEAQLSAQEAALSRSSASVSARKTSMATQVDQLNEQIKKSKISSPIDGVVLENFIRKGELAVQGRPLMRVAKLDTLILRAYVSGEELPRLKLGDQMRVDVDAGKGEMKSYSGYIQWISPKAEFTPKTVMSKQERDQMVYAIKVYVPNDGYLKIGMYGEIRKLP